MNNEFKLKSQCLLDEDVKKLYGNKFFKELDTEVKKEFWNYQLMIIDIDPKATRSDIINMFNRLNLTDYNLNDQEKRNSKSGEFAALARELSDISIWEEYRLFTNTDIKRMKDVEFCASLILLFRKGIIDQTDQSALNQAYEELQIEYKDAERDKDAVLDGINILPEILVSDDISLEEEHKLNLERFVQMYSVFENDMDLSGKINDTEKRLFDWLKKYKLASSEGLNKHTNRMIRYNVMKDFMFDFSDELIDASITLLNKMEEESSK